MSLRHRIALTRTWADKFRAAHAETPEIAPEGISQPIHNAMRESFLAHADELDAEADALVWRMVRPWVIAVAVALLLTALIVALA